MLRFFTMLSQQFVALLFVLFFVAIISIFGVYFYYFPQLPSVTELQKIRLEQPIRIYSREDKLIAEFGQYRRRLVKANEIPQSVIDAFIAIEDARFYQHEGVDLYSIARAVSIAIKDKELSQGASTITMQLARNYFLSAERTLSRKIKEIFLAIKIENNFSKEEIIALYLNKIFLGKRAYGIGAAAEIYYGKKLDQLTLAQTAMIAGLPKAPTKYNPINNPQRAKQRRDYILKRMVEQHYITHIQYVQATHEALSAKIHGTETEIYAPYMAEMVRAEILKRYGKDAYTLGLNVYTTLDSKEQTLASSTLRNHLIQYSRRHGYRGAEDRIDLSTLETEEQLFDTLNHYKTYADVYPALVVNVNKTRATVRTNQQTEAINLTLAQISWARRYINANQQGKKVRRVSDVLKAGDIIRIQRNSEDQWQLTQIPRVTGALVSLDPKDGAIRAIAGGFDFAYSKFNRAIQAKRQPGSSFKPFIYSAALAKGASPASIINDAPFRQAGSSWNPQNFDHRFSGLTRLRVALAKSKNLVSIHLLRKIGVDYAIDYAQKFGFKKENLPHNLTLALGTGSVSPLEMATAYSSFANGGYKVNNYYIRKIEDKNHQILFKANPKIACTDCSDIADRPVAPQIMQPYVNYQITSMLQTVAQVGTAARAGRTLQRTDIAGKTGTTNDQKDAWFCGFTPNKVTTVWIGFDNVQSLGKRETSTKAALPVWIDFMKVALNDSAIASFPRPEGLIDTRLDAKTGSKPTRFTTRTIVESLVAAQMPLQTTRYNYIRKHHGTIPTEQSKTITIAQQTKSIVTPIKRQVKHQKKYVNSRYIRNKALKKKRARLQRLRKKKAARKRYLLNKKRRQQKRAQRQRQQQQQRRQTQQVARKPVDSVEIPEQLF